MAAPRSVVAATCSSTMPPVPENVAAFSGRRCLVTGGLGFVGSNLVCALARAGAEVTVVDALVPRHGGNVHNLDGVDVSVIVADVGDAAAAGRAITSAEVVFNMAGQVSHVDSMDDPLGDLDLNTRSQLRFLEMLRRLNPDVTVVYASTRQIYGRPRYLPVDEQHPIEPIDVNGVTKHAAEEFHLLYGRLFGMRTTSVRLTNVYGPRQRLGGDHQGFLPIFVRRALDGEAITVFGDGSQERDCVHVDDVVDLVLRAARTPEAAGQVYNAGHHERLSLLQIARAVVEAAGSGTVELVPWPPDRARIDIGSYWSDASKAKAELGWEPTIPFSEGIAATVGYYRARRDWYR